MNYGETQQNAENPQLHGNTCYEDEAGTQVPRSFEIRDIETGYCSTGNRTTFSLFCPAILQRNHSY